MTAARAERLPDLKRRAFWLKHLHRWHWISAALSLVGLLGFAITGFTLNHAGAIEARPRVETRNAQLPDALLAQLRETPAKGSGPLPPAVREALARAFGIVIDAREAEWSEDEIYLSLQRPGGVGRFFDGLRSETLPLDERDGPGPRAGGAVAEDLVTLEWNDGNEPERKPQPRLVVLLNDPQVTMFADALERLQVVADPFLGLGSTAVACAQLGISFVGIEMDERYLKEAIARTRAALGVS